MRALKKMKNKKTGYRWKRRNMMKVRYAEGHDRTIETSLKQGKIPEEAKYYCALYKRGHTGNIGNYRGISLLYRTNDMRRY